MFDIVVKGIAVGNVFEGHSARPSDNVGIVSFKATVSASVTETELIEKILNNQRGRIEHF